MNWWPWKRKRSKSEIMISTLDAIAFVAIHCQSQDDLLTALRAYRSFQREAKAGRLETLELQMKVVAEQVGKELQRELNAHRARGA